MIEIFANVRSKSDMSDVTQLPRLSYKSLALSDIHCHRLNWRRMWMVVLVDVTDGWAAICLIVVGTGSYS